MDTKTVIGGAVSAVTFFLGIFGGFLLHIAPPGAKLQNFAVGLGSMVVLCLVLLLRSLVRGRTRGARGRPWLVAAIILLVLAVVAAFGYASEFDRLTFYLPPEANDSTLYLAGTTYTEDARDWMKKNPDLDEGHLVMQYGVNNTHLIWTKESTRHAYLILTALYLLVVISFAATVFSLTEGVLTGPPPASPPPAPAPTPQAGGSRVS